MALGVDRLFYYDLDVQTCHDHMFDNVLDNHYQFYAFKFVMDAYYIDE